MPARTDSSESLAPAARAGEERRDEPLPARRCEVERLLEASRALEDQDGTERLLLHDLAACAGFRRRSSAGSTRPAEPPGGGRPRAARGCVAPADAAARHDAAATRSRACDRDERAHLVAGSSGSPQRSAADGALEPFRGTPRRGPPRRSRAGWPCSAAPRRRTRRARTSCGRARQVRALPDDRGVVSAELRLERDPPARADLLRRPARERGARERHGVHARSLMRAAAARWSPATSLEHSRGQPRLAARARASAARAASPGGAGFQTTVFPSARAGPIFPHGIAIGLFHGVTTATTPSGTRRNADSGPRRAGPPPAGPDGIAHEGRGRRASASPARPAFRRRPRSRGRSPGPRRRGGIREDAAAGAGRRGLSDAAVVASAPLPRDPERPRPRQRAAGLNIVRTVWRPTNAEDFRPDPGADVRRRDRRRRKPGRAAVEVPARHRRMERVVAADRVLGHPPPTARARRRRARSRARSRAGARPRRSACRRPSREGGRELRRVERGKEPLRRRRPRPRRARAPAAAAWPGVPGTHRQRSSAFQCGMRSSRPGIDRRHRRGRPARRLRGRRRAGGRPCATTSAAAGSSPGAPRKSFCRSTRSRTALIHAGAGQPPDGRGDALSHLGRADDRRPRLRDVERPEPVPQHLFDAGVDPARLAGEAEALPQHHRERGDLADRIRASLPRQIVRRPVVGLVDGRAVAREVSGEGHPPRREQHGADVREHVAEEVGGGDHVEGQRAPDQPIGGEVDVHERDLDAGPPRAASRPTSAPERADGRDDRPP